MSNPPELVMVVGCNAAGKSTFIRTRLNHLINYEVFMTDVYKSRTKELTKQAIHQHKNIIVETVFNDSSFKDLVDLARNSGYQTNLIVLFLDKIEDSITRVALRATQQTGLLISGNNVELNFNESFKNVEKYFFYFDRSEFLFTGNGNTNQLIMQFKKSELVVYHANSLAYIQKFAAYSYLQQRLSESAYNLIILNKSFQK